VIGLAAAFTAAAIFGPQFIYTVKPSEMGNVRRLGTMRFEEPVGPGPHFKIPFIDKVDTLQTSLRTLHMPAFSVKTVDNQQVTLEINFNYTVPKDQVNRLLYDIGKAGGDSIDSSIKPVAMDRAARIFAQQNTTLISANREKIQAEVQEKVFAALHEQFGIEPHSLQIAQIGYSPSFVKSNEEAVLAKNDALAEENKERIKSAQALQAIIRSEGTAKAAIETARGQSESSVIIAEANRDALKLKGEGQAALTKAGIEVFGSPEAYLRYLEAKAALKWDGQRPQVEVGNGSNVNTVVVPAAPKP
jgi:regulator of protease activity HflC (stomatin/prohibitin superfamily)